MTKIGVMGRLVALMLLVWVTACARDGATADPDQQPATPVTLRMAAARSRQKAPGYDFVPDAGGTLRARAGDAETGAAVVATARGVRLSRRHGDGLELGVETASVGRDGARHGRGVVRERAEGQELVIDRRGRCRGTPARRSDGGGAQLRGAAAAGGGRGRSCWRWRSRGWCRRRAEQATMCCCAMTRGACERAIAIWSQPMPKGESSRRGCRCGGRSSRS